ncbi:hypothetical protein [Crateriforma conspicua]|nr:hypothetical protein [Crateriforma conspicua]
MQQDKCSLDDICTYLQSRDEPASLVQFDANAIPRFAGHLIASYGHEHFVLISSNEEGGLAITDPPKPTRLLGEHDRLELTGTAVLIGQTLEPSGVKSIWWVALAALLLTIYFVFWFRRQ